MGLVMLIYGSNLVISDNYARKGDVALKKMLSTQKVVEKNEQFRKAGYCFDKAVKFDTLNAYHKAKLAYISALNWKYLYNLKDPKSTQAYQHTISLIQDAHKLQPYDNDLNNYLVESIVVLGDLNTMLVISQGAIQANPNDIHTYNLYIDSLWTGIEYYQNNNNLDKVKELSFELINVEKTLEKQKMKLKKNLTFWNGDPLVLSPDSEFSIGKTYYLLGNYEKAQARLALLTVNNLSKNDVSIWYAASLYKCGQEQAANEILFNYPKKQEATKAFKSLINKNPL